MAVIETLLSYIGGIGVVIIGIVKFSTSLMEKKMERKFEKEKTLFQSKLDKQQYISRTRFDVEFNIYRNLSQKFGLLILRMLADTSCCEYNEERNGEMCKLAYEAVMELYGSAPFIKKDLYDNFTEIYEKCRQMIAKYDELIKKKNCGYNEKLENEARELFGEYNKIIDKVREYNSNIEVIS